MDSWPGWLRWALVIPAACVASLFAVLAAPLVDQHHVIAALVSLLLFSALFVWLGVATAPSSKLVVAAILGFVVLGFDFAAYVEGVREANGGGFLSNMLIDLWRGTAPSIIGGVIVAWGLIL